jgi:NADPH2:quinone reductase
MKVKKTRTKNTRAPRRPKTFSPMETGQPDQDVVPGSDNSAGAQGSAKRSARRTGADRTGSLMKAIQIRAFGATADLMPREVLEPPLSAGEARVRVEAAGVNPSDVKNFEGRMRQTRLPRILGRDFSGTVVEGPAAWIGRTVWGTGGDLGFTRDGSFAQRLVVSSKALLEIPVGRTPVQIATVALPTLTAWEALKRLTLDWREKSLLVVGGTGAVGSCAATLAQRRGARVWRTTRHRTEGDGEGWIDLSAGLMRDQALKATEGNGMDYIFNTVGGETFQPSLASLAHHGRMAVIASAGSPEVTFNMIDFYHQELTLVGLDTLAFDAVTSAASLREILPDLQSPEFRPLPAQTFSLESSADAFRYKGKAVLLPNG